MASAENQTANGDQAGTSPLDYAVSRRDAGILKMVADAVKHDHALLAYQPIVRTHANRSVAFYEGLIRVLDPTGRLRHPGATLTVARVEDLHARLRAVTDG